MCELVPLLQGEVTWARGRAVPEGPSMPPATGWKVWRFPSTPPEGLQEREEEVGQEGMYKNTPLRGQFEG